MAVSSEGSFSVIPAATRASVIKAISKRPMILIFICRVLAKEQSLITS
jgi:hypothetical protein